MTLRQKYKSLNDPVFVKKMIVNSVYNTMKLEGQLVARNKVENLYDQVMKERQEKANSPCKTDKPF